MIYICLSTTRHWQTFGRLVQELNVYCMYWIALAEHSQGSTNLLGFKYFFSFLHHFVLANLATRSIRDTIIYYIWKSTNTVLVFNYCTKCAATTAIIHDRTPGCRPFPLVLVPPLTSQLSKASIRRPVGHYYTWLFNSFICYPLMLVQPLAERRPIDC